MHTLLRVGLVTLALMAGCGDSSDDDNGASSGANDQTGGTQETVIAEGCEGLTPAATVSITSGGFDRREVDISSGSTVRWVNNGNENHTVLSGEPDHSDAGSLFQSGQLSPGDSFCYTFASSADVDFFCGEHPSEQGEVEVDGDDTPDDDGRDDDGDDDNRGRG